MRTRVIYAFLFGENAIIVENVADLVARMQEEEQMFLDYVPQYAALQTYVPFLLALWVQIRLSNWLDKKLADRDVPPPLHTRCV